MAAELEQAGPAGRQGQARDLTAGPIGSTLLLFSLPVLGSNVLQSLNGSANAFWVSHVLGEAALTATSNANNVLFLMLGVVFGISMSANLLISQAVGARDVALVKRVIGSSTSFFLVLSILVGLIGFLATPAILTAMGTPADARAPAIAYLRVIFVALIFLYFFNFLMMAMRGAGDSRTPFLFSLMAVGLDVLLNPVLIMGLGPAPRLGIAGSAASTLIAQVLTLGAMLAYLHRSRSILVLRRAEWRLLVPDWRIVRSLVFKGMPMGFQMLVVSGAAIVMMSMVNSYGSHTAAAYGACLQLWTYVQMPAMALGAGVSSMAAQNVGAKRLDRVDRIAGVALLQSVTLTGGVVLLVYLVEPYALRLFLPATSPSLPIAAHLNHIVLWGFIPFGMTFMLTGVVRATGAVWPPLLAVILAGWVVRIPFARAALPYMGADAIWWSFPLANITSVAFLAGYYRWGGWRNAKMLDTTPRGSAPDTGQGAPIGAEESEVAAQAAWRSPPEESARPASRRSD